MSPDYQQSMLGVAISGLCLLAVLFVPLAVLNWRELRAWVKGLAR